MYVYSYKYACKYVCMYIDIHITFKSAYEDDSYITWILILCIITYTFMNIYAWKCIYINIRKYVNICSIDLHTYKFQQFYEYFSKFLCCCHIQMYVFLELYINVYINK
jgi:hypothetical protein